GADAFRRDAGAVLGRGVAASAAAAAPACRRWGSATRGATGGAPPARPAPPPPACRRWGSATRGATGGATTAATTCRGSCRGSRFAGDGGRAVVGNDQHIVLVDEIPRLDFGVENGGIGEIELLQHEAGPALVAIAASEALVHGDTL